MKRIFSFNLTFQTILTLYTFLFFFTTSNLYSEIAPMILISNWKDTSCGVAEHSRHFAQTLRDKGIKVIKLDAFEIFANKRNMQKAILKIFQTKPQAINFQYHPGLYEKFNDRINSFMHTLKRDYGIRTALACHSESEGMENVLNEASLFIYYFKPKYANLDQGSKSVYIPLPAPSFQLTSTPNQIRSKYGYGVDDIIISTGGFVFEHKRIAEIIYQLGTFLNDNRQVKLQLVISTYPNNLSSAAEMANIQAAVNFNGLANQVYITGRFLDTQEYLERLSISDLGFSWCPPDPYDSSAIEKDFVAVRVPLITNDVGHNQLKNGEGVLKVNDDLEDFTFGIMSLVLDPEKRYSLQKEMEQSYSLLNYSNAVDMHLKYFKKMKNRKK